MLIWLIFWLDSGLGLNRLWVDYGRDSGSVLNLYGVDSSGVICVSSALPRASGSLTSLGG